MTKRILFFLAFLEGSLVMTLELTIPHVLSPILGNSMNTWAILIMLSVGGLAIGYFLGAFLSAKKNNETSNSKSSALLVLTACVALLGIITLFLVDISNRGSLLEDEISSAYTIAICGLFLPSILLAATTPILIAKLSRETSTAGTLYAFSTWGGVLFTLLSGFIFIPDHGLIKTLQIATFLSTVMFAIVAFYRGGRFRFFSFGAIGIGFLTFGIGKFSLHETNNVKVLELKEGLNGQLMVVETEINDSTVDRTLFINRMGQTWVRITNGTSIASLWSYPGILKSLASCHGKQSSNALVLGLGGGIVPLFLSDKQNLNYTIDAVELDKDIIRFSKEYFSLPDDINVIEDDARRVLNANKNLYDLIVMDIFNGEIAPSHVLSVEAFEKVKTALTDRGIVIINFNGNITGEAGISGRSLYKTLIHAGFQVQMLPTFEEGERNRNNLFVATLKPLDLEKKMTIPITYFKNGKLETYGIKQNLFNFDKLDLSDALIITDDYPLMEQINQMAARQWREDYLKNVTLKYRDQGIPLIK
jgi:spermidine synthase